MEEICQGYMKSDSILMSNRNSVTNRQRRNSFLRNYLRQQSKRFSNNILSNTFVTKKQTFLKLFALHLQTRPELRTQVDVEATSRILSEQNIFPEFKNDIKILRMLAKHLNLISYAPGQKIYSQKSQNTNLYKVIQGYVVLQKKNKKEIRQKGDFLEKLKQFTYIKNYEAVSFAETYLLSISHVEYTLVNDLFIQNKVIIKMLKTTPLLKSFTHNQINNLVEICETRDFCHSEIIIDEGEDLSLLSKEEKTIFYLIQGEISIYKFQKHLVCTLSDNCIIGQQLLFFDFPFPYTAKVKSLTAKILCITHKKFLDLLKSAGLSFQSFTQDLKYDEAIKNKLKHYQNYVETSKKVKTSVFERVASKSMDSCRRDRLQKFTNVVGEVQKKVSNLQKINKRRLNFTDTDNEISFVDPLFKRQDFPLLQSSLKRFANEEKLALKKMKASKALFVR